MTSTSVISDTNTSGEHPVSRVLSAFRQGLRAFRHWRRQRPFWAGIWVLLGAAPIIFFANNGLTTGNVTIRLQTTGGTGSVLIGAMLVLLSLVIWLKPPLRVFAGIGAIVLALISLVVTNFGGFLLGFLFTAIGGMLAVSWMYVTPQGVAPDRDPAASEEEQITSELGRLDSSDVR